MKVRLFSILLFGLAGGLASTPAVARNFVLYSTTTPMVYRYASCAYATDMPTIEEQLAKCSDLREEMLEAADEILPRFNPREVSDARRNLAWAFDDIDQEAASARGQRKTVPASIVAYLQCMGESVMATEDFQSGVAVDFIGIEEACVNEHVLSVTFVQTEQELERIKLLYQQFSRTGRFVDNLRLGSGIASTGDGASALRPGRRLSRSRAPVMPRYRVKQGLLILHRLPADEAPQ